jgi:hypothetical protein
MVPCELTSFSVKEEDFAKWYSDVKSQYIFIFALRSHDCAKVVIQCDLIDDYDVGGHDGFYVMKPWSYKIWENIQSAF